MGPFDHIQKKGSNAIRPQPAQIRKEIISTVISVRKTSNLPPQRYSNGVKAKTNRPISPAVKGRTKDTKQKLSNLQQPLESDSDEAEEEGDHSESERAPRKRQRIDLDVKPDIRRKMRNEKSFSKNSHGIPSMVHAADIATVRNSTKYRSAFSRTPDLHQVELEYPSTCAVEK